jgi:hypothetical protein
LEGFVTVAKKAAAKAEPSIVVTVTGRHAVDGVAPGGVLGESDPIRLRALSLAGHVTVTVGGKPLSDGAFVMYLEGNT